MTGFAAIVQRWAEPHESWCSLTLVALAFFTAALLSGLLFGSHNVWALPLTGLALQVIPIHLPLKISSWAYNLNTCEPTPRTPIVIASTLTAVTIWVRRP